MLHYLLLITEDDHIPQIEYLYNRFHDEMMRLGKSQLRNAGDNNYLYDAEDVVQASFVKISKYIKSIDFSKSDQELKTYVFRILTNEVNNFLSDRDECDNIEDHLGVLSDEDFFERVKIEEEYNEVVQAIKALDDKYSTVMMCRYYDEMEVKDVAELMGLTEKTIYTRLDRGKKLLLVQLERV